MAAADTSGIDGADEGASSNEFSVREANDALGGYISDSGTNDGEGGSSNDGEGDESDE